MNNFIPVLIIIAGNLKQPGFLFLNGFSQKNRMTIVTYSHLIRIKGFNLIIKEPKRWGGQASVWEVPSFWTLELEGESGDAVSTSHWRNGHHVRCCDVLRKMASASLLPSKFYMSSSLGQTRILQTIEWQDSGKCSPKLYTGAEFPRRSVSPPFANLASIPVPLTKAGFWIKTVTAACLHLKGCNSPSYHWRHINCILQRRTMKSYRSLYPSLDDVSSSSWVTLPLLHPVT